MPPEKCLPESEPKSIGELYRRILYMFESHEEAELGKFDQFDDSIKELTVKVDSYLEAFPDGPKSHREFHQAQMDAAVAQKKFWDDLTSDLKKRGIKAVILIVLGLFVLKVFGTEAAKTLLKIMA